MLKISRWMVALTLALSLVVSTRALAAKTYQVTGVIVKLTEKIITLEKGTGDNKEKWEIDRDSDTKVNGDLKEGAKVTIEYTMSAKNIEVKK